MGTVALLAGQLGEEDRLMLPVVVFYSCWLGDLAGRLWSLEFGVVR